MRRRPPSSLLPIVLLLARAAAAAPDAEEAHRQMGEAERARAANLDAQRQAAERAEAAEAEARRLGAERVAAAQRLRETELAATAARARMQGLERERAETETRLRASADSLAPLLPVIERLSLYPSETLLAVDAAPDDALRGILVLQGIGRMLESRARTLRSEQARLDTIRQAMTAEAPRLAAAQTAEAAQSAELDRQIAAAQARGREADDDASRFAQAAAAQAARQETLRGVITAIEAERRAAEARARSDARRAERDNRHGAAAGAERRLEALARPVGRGLGAAEARLTAPVTGTKVRGFGEVTDAGPASGITYRAPPGGVRVVAPCAGRAVFAAPFRSFGQLLILDCGDNYHVVLAGFGRLDVHAGLPVQAGEPVGVMPPEGGALYLELRRASQPVNPAAWLKARG